ncbi:MAG: hypothetical protein IPJ74_26335 [Saprospiraceae bacterium]|nr:hypothetical protein [Saprospiraceae bacterium]
MSATLRTRPEEMSFALKNYLKRVATKSKKVQILRSGAGEVRKVARQSPTPKSKKLHYYYSKRGKTPIYPGNLRKSMSLFRDRKDDIQVGPKVIRRLTASEIGQTTKTASGFYAAALFGSASRFRIRIMEAALQKARSAAFQKMERKFAQIHAKENRL